MRHITAAMLLFLFAAGFVPAGERGSRVMSGWFNATTPDGWAGRRYMDGNEIFAEEFDSNGDNRIDVWRFYRRGMLSSEERDLNGDGKIDYQSRWDPRERRLISALRDTRWRGVNDLEIESPSRRRWEIREDRNRDGVTDRILIVNGPPDLFERLGIDLSSQEDVIDAIPPEYRYELWSDDTFTGAITDYRRFTRGNFTHYGEWDGNKVVWRRVTADFVPPPPPDAAQPTARTAATGGEPSSNAPAGGGEYGAPAASRNDQDFGQPYDQPYDQTYDQTYDQARDQSFNQSYGDPLIARDPDVLGAPPRIQDRTRYEGLPPGDSAAHSLPARMRPPGVGRR